MTFRGQIKCSCPNSIPGSVCWEVIAQQTALIIAWCNRSRWYTDDIYDEEVLVCQTSVQEVLRKQMNCSNHPHVDHTAVVLTVAGWHVHWHEAGGVHTQSPNKLQEHWILMLNTCFISYLSSIQHFHIMCLHYVCTTRKALNALGELTTPVNGRRSVIHCGLLNPFSHVSSDRVRWWFQTSSWSVKSCWWPRASSTLGSSPGSLSHSTHCVRSCCPNRYHWYTVTDVERNGFTAAAKLLTRCFLIFRPSDKWMSQRLHARSWFSNQPSNWSVTYE